MAVSLETADKYVTYIRKKITAPGSRAALRRSLGRPVTDTATRKAHSVVAAWLPSERTRPAVENAYYGVAAMIAAQPRRRGEPEEAEDVPPPIEEKSGGEPDTEREKKERPSTSLGATLGAAIKEKKLNRDTLASGIVNWALGVIGVSGPGWWTDPAWAMPSIILASAWKDLGFVMIILLAGLQAIPREYQEAAMVDGAGAVRRFRHITLPLLSPSTFFVVVISLINGFQVFDQVQIMTGGGPGGATQVVVSQIYDLTFRYGRAGAASALSWLLFALVLLVTIVQIRGQRRWVTYG